MFNPALPGVSTAREDWQKTVDAWNAEKAEQAERSGRLVRTMVSKFVGDSALAPAEAAPAPKKSRGEGFLGRAISSILSRRKKGKSTKDEEYTEIHVIAPSESADKDK